jgi:hypothetical protein
MGQHELGELPRSLNRRDLFVCEGDAEGLLYAEDEFNTV